MTVISLLRAVNIGSRKVPMNELRELYESCGFSGARTFIQSGNVVFKSKRRDTRKLAFEIESAIEQKFGFRSEVIVRTLLELEQVIADNPFVERVRAEPSRVLVLFLRDDPGPQARENVMSLKTAPEDLRAIGRELYIYFPSGMGRTKLPWTQLDKMMKTCGTGRNWNTVLKLRDLAREMEG